MNPQDFRRLAALDAALHALETADELSPTALVWRRTGWRTSRTILSRIPPRSGRCSACELGPGEPRRLCAPGQSSPTRQRLALSKLEKTLLYL